jgi:hypothetical protein
MDTKISESFDQSKWIPIPPTMNLDDSLSPEDKKKKLLEEIRELRRTCIHPNLWNK